jgi:hypothetical protein
LRILKGLSEQNRNKRATLVQKYIRGTLGRKQFCRMMKENIIQPNLQYLTDITKRAHENSQIIIRYHWKKYLARKAAKKAKKAAAAAAAS